MNEKYEILLKVYEIRKYKLINSTTSEIRDILLKDYKLFDQVDNLLQICKKMRKDRFLFIFYLFIKGSCCWEGYSLNTQGQKRFDKECYDFRFFQHALFHLNKFQLSIKNEVNLEIFQDDSILEKAKNNLKNNIKILKKIVQINITYQDLDQYFENVKFFVFNCDELQEYLHGFSSYDGKYVYISLKQIDDKPLTEIIECQVVDNIYFWLIKNENPLLIMSEINNQLLGELGGCYEPSDYYISQIYGRIIVYDGPFKFSTLNQQIWFK